MMLAFAELPGAIEWIVITFIYLIVLGIVLSLLICFVSSHDRIAKSMTRIANKLENDNKIRNSDD